MYASISPQLLGLRSRWLLTLVWLQGEPQAPDPKWSEKELEMEAAMGLQSGGAGTAAGRGAGGGSCGLPLGLRGASLHPRHRLAPSAGAESRPQGRDTSPPLGTAQDNQLLEGGSRPVQGWPPTEAGSHVRGCWEPPLRCPIQRGQDSVRKPSSSSLCCICLRPMG